MHESLLMDYSLKPKHCVGELNWFDAQYHVYRITLEGGGGGANELYLAIQEEFSDNEGPFPINDDVAGTWVEIGQGENEPLQCFLCEDTEGVLNVLLSYDPNNPYKNND
ncbi:Hypothetical predicted protein [Prunus dulcis]|uniref:Uncharacterized protein n=1 Tax=Prunus dulcis TaxID=3755 RepID=A0A5E4GLA9_PRUDU|nr:Hypothetical predicted protein [Prunus dulcis]